MLNKKPCLCYLCRATIQAGQYKKRIRPGQFAHVGCNREPKRKSWYLKLLSLMWKR